MPLRLSSPTGPAVARLFHALLALNLLIAWLSLGAQVRVLIGARGLLPLTETLASVRARPHLNAWDLPTLFWWVPPTDTALVLGCGLGALLALVALLGWVPRTALFLSGLLYLSYIHASQTFLSFQWDNLLVECCLLAALLPRDRSSPLAHLLLRLLLFKVFFESGIAKWQSSLGDWQSGDAMMHYYQTAPIPTVLAWFAHHLPAWWHWFESWWTLFFELVLSLGIFGPRPARLVALAAFTGFLLLDSATANYGFFCSLTAALCVFLLDESWAARLDRWLPQRTTLLAPRPEFHRVFVAVFATGWLALSAADALDQFADISWLSAPRAAARTWRVANTYHLFGAITTQRVEPEFQTTTDGTRWEAQDLRYKPGDPTRAPPFVAPHQPRVDFRLWFYGLSWRRGTDAYVGNLLRRLCLDPSAVQPLFPAALPAHPLAVRIVYWETRFTTAEERAATGSWWDRELVEESPVIPCAKLAPR